MPFFSLLTSITGILDINSWHSIFLTLQKTEILFDRIRTQITPSPVVLNRGGSKVEQDKDAVKRLINQEDENSLALDLQILSAALDSLFTQSLHYPVAFILLINSLTLLYRWNTSSSS